MIEPNQVNTCWIQTLGPAVVWLPACVNIMVQWDFLHLPPTTGRAMNVVSWSCEWSKELTDNCFTEDNRQSCVAADRQVWSGASRGRGRCSDAVLPTETIPTLFCFVTCDRDTRHQSVSVISSIISIIWSLISADSLLSWVDLAADWRARREAPTVSGGLDSY